MQKNEENDEMQMAEFLEPNLSHYIKTLAARKLHFTGLVSQRFRNNVVTVAERRWIR